MGPAPAIEPAPLPQPPPYPPGSCHGCIVCAGGEDLRSDKALPLGQKKLSSVSLFSGLPDYSKNFYLSQCCTNVPQIQNKFLKTRQHIFKTSKSNSELNIYVQYQIWFIFHKGVKLKSSQNLKFLPLNFKIFQTLKVSEVSKPFL